MKIGYRILSDFTEAELAICLGVAAGGWVFYAYEGNGVDPVYLFLCVIAGTTMAGLSCIFNEIKFRHVPHFLYGAAGAFSAACSIVVSPWLATLFHAQLLVLCVTGSRKFRENPTITIVINDWLCTHVVGAVIFSLAFISMFEIIGTAAGLAGGILFFFLVRY